ncbi:MAG: discoidin domain-containing protein [Candidatus Viridilinea halotolerans]|uniref:Discoidin domain-containing protein n=1 Tax=Candidatus Viridilinea halotolerans TaxID=2491704 RepID=A0A426U5N3_9CHLR|nr:MAG: discoidin domain-containing protein [Candidatus Viridilinea halotolerans]
MPRKAIELSGGELVRTPDLVEASEVATVPSINGIPRANAEGRIAAGWVAPLAIDQVPVAAAGEVSSQKIVRADDPRLGSSTTGGDLAGPVVSATVVRLQNRAFSATAPANGQVPMWSHALNRWEPGTISSGGGGSDGNATQIQGWPVDSAEPSAGDMFAWNGAMWTPTRATGNTPYVTDLQLIGTVDGTNTLFMLPMPAKQGTISVTTRPVAGGDTQQAPFTPAFPNLLLNRMPIFANGYNSGGFYGSSPVSCVVDGKRTVSPFWSSGYTTPVLRWDFEEATALVSVVLVGTPPNGFGGCSTYRVERSDNGIDWTVALASGDQGQDNNLTGIARYWQVVGLTRGQYEWSVSEVEFYGAVAHVTSINVHEAPSPGLAVFASYEVAQHTSASLTTDGSDGEDGYSRIVAALYCNGMRPFG